MMKFCLKLVVFLASIPFTSFTQKKTDSLLLGSWQYHRFTYKGKTTNADSNSTYFMSFFPDSVCQTLSIWRSIPDTSVTGPDGQKMINRGSHYVISRYSSGSKWWTHGRDSVFLFGSHPLKTPYYYYPPSTSYLRIDKLTDSSLVIFDTYRRRTSYTEYRKIPSLQLQPDTFRPIEYTPGITYSYFLVNSATHSKKVRIKEYDPLDIYIYTDLSSGRVDGHFFSGNMVSMTDTGLKLEVSRESFTRNGSEVNTTYAYYDNSSDSMREREFSIRNIKTIKHSSRGRETANSLSNGLIVIASITALVAAPLVSINYRGGGFNTNRYFTYALCGLGGIAINIPIALLTRSRTYTIIDKNSPPDQKEWYLERESIYPGNVTFIRPR